MSIGWGAVPADQRHCGDVDLSDLPRGFDQAIGRLRGLVLHTIWSAKGGSGVSVTAATLASIFAQRDGTALLVDLCGDQPALLGLAEPSVPGVFDWLAADHTDESSIERLKVEVGTGVRLLVRGRATDWLTDRTESLVEVLERSDCEVVIDGGVLDDRAPSDDQRAGLIRSLASSGRSILVTTTCYLALRRAMNNRTVADGVVVLSEAGRALNGRDVSSVLDLPLLASIDLDPAVGRAVDSGTFARRWPRPLDRALAGVA